MSKTRKKSDAEQGPPYVGPITQQAMERQAEGPPALMREWHRALKQPGNFILLWAGAILKPDGHGNSWSMMFICTGDEPAPNPEPPINSDVAAKMETMLAPLAHESRVRILQSLYRGPSSPTELSELTGLKGGSLYHHLRELLYAAYVRDEQGKYQLTDLGRQLLVSFTSIASKVVQDRGTEGLMMGDNW